jgi:hypothetical protein
MVLLLATARLCRLSEVNTMREVSKRRKRIKLIACIIGGVAGVSLTMFLLFLAVIGAFDPDRGNYIGDYPDLFTVAINSILNTRGFSEYSTPMPVTLEVIETDAYGRVLFLYTEEFIHRTDATDAPTDVISAYNLVISQYNDGEYVYFYPHHNFISVGRMLHIPRSDFVPDISQLAEDFTAEAIEKLKERNSWNQELNLDNAIRVPIVYTKERYGPISREILLSTYIELFELESARWHGFSTFFIADTYGRSIYTFSWRRTGGGHFVVIFQPDGSFDRDTGVMKLLDLQRYQDELKTLKEQNGWNQPFL